MELLSRLPLECVRLVEVFYHGVCWEPVMTELMQLDRVETHNGVCWRTPVFKKDGLKRHVRARTFMSPFNALRHMLATHEGNDTWLCCYIKDRTITGRDLDAGIWHAHYQMPAYEYWYDLAVYTTIINYDPAFNADCETIAEIDDGMMSGTIIFNIFSINLAGMHPGYLSLCTPYLESVVVE